MNLRRESINKINLYDKIKIIKKSLNQISTIGLIGTVIAIENVVLSDYLSYKIEFEHGWIGYYLKYQLEKYEN